jgi:hypothetical protein
MVGLTASTLSLLVAGRAAGLTVQLRGGQVVIRGPRSAEELAHRLADRKPELRVWLDPRPTWALLTSGRVELVGTAGLPPGCTHICCEGDREWAKLAEPVPESVKRPVRRRPGLFDLGDGGWKL